MDLPKACQLIDDFAKRTIEGEGDDSHAKTALTQAAAILGVDLSSV